jgi:hypothetical protein
VRDEEFRDKLPAKIPVGKQCGKMVICNLLLEFLKLENRIPQI